MNRQFYSASARGGAVLFLSAALMFLLGVLLLAVRADLASSQAWVLGFLLTAVAAFVGLKKLAAPVVLVEATAEALIYHHPRGSWRLAWQQVAHVQQIELQGRELAWIGVRLHNYDELLQTDLLIPADFKDCSAREFSQFINRQRLNFTPENNG